MNEEKIKSQLISQYFGQRIWHIGLMQPQLINGYSLLKYEKVEDSYLLLRDVSQLEDSEMDVIAELKGYKFWTDEYKQKLINGTLILNHRCYEYLKLIGVATDFTYLNSNNQPETLSVEEQIKMGFIKIKEA